MTKTIVIVIIGILLAMSLGLLVDVYNKQTLIVDQAAVIDMHQQTIAINKSVAKVTDAEGVWITCRVEGDYHMCDHD